MKEAYINFLNHCYIDTEVEMKEIYTSNHMWTLFEKSFIIDMGIVATATHDREHADTALELYVTNCLMNIITMFFSSPFSDQSTTLQVIITRTTLIRQLNGLVFYSRSFYLYTLDSFSIFPFFILYKTSLLLVWFFFLLLSNGPIYDEEISLMNTVIS